MNFLTKRIKKTTHRYSRTGFALVFSWNPLSSAGFRFSITAVRLNFIWINIHNPVHSILFSDRVSFAQVFHQSRIVIWSIAVGLFPPPPLLTGPLSTTATGEFSRTAYLSFFSLPLFPLALILYLQTVLLTVRFPLRRRLAAPPFPGRFFAPEIDGGFHPIRITSWYLSPAAIREQRPHNGTRWSDQESSSSPERNQSSKSDIIRKKVINISAQTIVNFNSFSFDTEIKGWNHLKKN